MSNGSGIDDQSDNQLLELRVSVDPAIERLLIDNETDIADLLARNGVAVQRFTGDTGSGSRWVDLDASGLKEPVTILLATAAVIAAATPLLGRLLTELSRKSVLVEELVPVPVEDSRGNILTDQDGRPIVRWVPRQRFVETTDRPDKSESLQITGPMGIHVTYNRTHADQPGTEVNRGEAGDRR